MNRPLHPLDAAARSRALNAGLAFALLAAVLAAVSPARADGDPRTDGVPRLFHYDGLLELDGHPVDQRDAPMLLQFAIYDGRDAAEPIYRQTVGTRVYDGQFSVNFGPIGTGPQGEEVPIEAVIARADALFLGITLLGDEADPGDDIPLANRQPLFATPYAIWTTAASDLYVAAEARVGGDLTVQGEVRAHGGIIVGGDVQVPEGAIDSAEIADGSLTAREIDANALGGGVEKSGNSLRLDTGFLDGRTRSWVRSHCSIRFGWRNRCSNCDEPPAKNVTVRADGVCTGASGADTRCRANNTWGGVNLDGAASTDDVFYIRLICS